MDTIIYYELFQWKDVLLSSHQWPLFSQNFPLVCISKHVAFTFWLIKYWITIQRNICEAASSHFWEEENKLLLISSSFCIDLWCYLFFFFPVYESGACFSPDVLDITSEDILSRFVEVCPTKKSEKDVTQVTHIMI